MKSDWSGSPNTPLQVSVAPDAARLEVTQLFLQKELNMSVSRDEKKEDEKYVTQKRTARSSIAKQSDFVGGRDAASI
jgi:hypothetical protein